MILLCGVADEPVTSKLLAHIIARKLDYVFLDERDLFKNIHLDMVISQNQIRGNIIFNKWKVPVNEIKGLYNRLWLSSERLQSVWPDNKDMYHATKVLDFFINSFPGPVVNRPDSLISNGFKLNQYIKIIRNGFLMPFTFTTSHLETALRIIDNKPENWILKSNSGVRSKVRQVNSDDIRLWKKYKSIPPLQFQKLLKGYNIRVHVLDDEVFACSIKTTEVDYRYGENKKFEIITLPEKIKQNCIKLTRDLRLSFSGIDLFFTTNNEWYCFEVNCTPGYSWYEDNAKLKISEALCKFLSR